MFASVELDRLTRSTLVGFSEEQHGQLEAHLVRLMGTYTLEGASIWLLGRNRALGNRRPMDMVASGSSADLIALDKLVERYEAGNAG